MKLRSKLILLSILAVLLIVGISFCTWKAFRPFRVPTGAMTPTIELGSLVWINEFAYFESAHVKRGDVITFDIISKYPGLEGNRSRESSVYIFRVMGVPGDDLQVSRLGKVTINGVPLQERSTGDEHWEFQQDWYQVLPMGRPFTDRSDLSEGGAFSGKIPQKKFFVMGDNRGNAYDSRFWGFVPFKDIRGKMR